MTGMHVREPRPCAPPLRGKHSGYKGPTTARYVFSNYVKTVHVRNNSFTGLSTESIANILVSK